jgi:serine/threonine protein kinase
LVAIPELDKKTLQTQSYQISDVIGSGLHGSVYKDKHQIKINEKCTDVAIKVIDINKLKIEESLSFRQKLNDEKKIIHEVRHPFIVNVNLVLENLEQQRVYEIMEYSDSRDLETYPKKRYHNQKVSMKQLRNWIKQIANDIYIQKV